jgi:hypothetical protein
MSNPFCAVIKYQEALANQFMRALVSILNLYAGLLDPRPDLSTPARAVKVPYAWWW